MVHAGDDSPLAKSLERLAVEKLGDEKVKGIASHLLLSTSFGSPEMVALIGLTVVVHKVV